MIGATSLNPRLWRDEARAAVQGARAVVAPPSADIEAVRALVRVLAPRASVQTPPAAVGEGDPDATARWLEREAGAHAPAPLIWIELSDPMWMGEASSLCAALHSLGVSCRPIHGAPVGIGGPGFLQTLWPIGAAAALERRLDRALLGAHSEKPPPSLATMSRGSVEASTSPELRDIPWALDNGTKLPTAEHPLVGRRIGSTQAPTAGRVPFAAMLAAFGATCVTLPCLHFAPPADLDALDAAAAALPGRGALLTSAQGVHALVEALTRIHGSTSAARKVLAVATIATIGPRTTQALARLDVHPDVIASPAHAEGLVAALRDRHLLSRTWTLFRADEGRDTLRQAVAEAGGNVDVIEAYRVIAPEVSAPRARALLGIASQATRNSLDAICVTSGRAGRHLLRLVERATDPALANEWLRTVPMIAIGPVTATALGDMGLSVAETADHPSHAGLVRALARTL